MTQSLSNQAVVIDLGAYRATHPATAGRPPLFPAKPSAARVLSERAVAHRRAMLDNLARARPTRALS